LPFLLERPGHLRAHRRRIPLSCFYRFINLLLKTSMQCSFRLVLGSAMAAVATSGSASGVCTDTRCGGAAKLCCEGSPALQKKSSELGRKNVMIATAPSRINARHAPKCRMPQTARLYVARATLLATNGLPHVTNRQKSQATLMLL
jgi:hypothetical protein